MKRFWLGILLGTLGLSAIAGAQSQDMLNVVKPAKTVTHKDWMLGCDNVAACQAVALVPSANYPDFLSFVVARNADSDAALKITALGQDSKSDRYRIMVDGKMIVNGSVRAGEAPATIEGPEAIRLARAMARGVEVRLLDGTGALIGRASLQGARTSFQSLDKAQGRTGTKTAILNPGRRAMRIVMDAVPVIKAKRILESSSIPDTLDLVALAENSACAAERSDVTQDAVYSLGAQGDSPRALVLVSCGGGAYNPTGVAYLGTKAASGKWTFKQAGFDYDAYSKFEHGALKLLFHPSWNPANQTLSSYAKGRGIGDCGNSAQYIWDGALFRLTEATAMSECRGSINWIPVWRAQVQLVD
jgi:Protein of unknown function (DUF1176)